MNMFDCGLVLEGGGNRGIFTSGVLDAFMENGIEFPYVIGVSAGSCNGTSFLGKNIRRQHDIIINYCNDKRYTSLKSMFKKGEYMNGDWIFGELSYDISPLNQENFENSDAEFCVVVTNAYTGKAEYMYPKSMREYGCPIIRASCSMPLATKGTQIGDCLYFDGGIADSIPLQKAYDDGCKKCIVVMTQDKLFVKQPFKKPGLIKKSLKKYPNLADAMINRYEMYNAEKRFVEEESIKGNVFTICPPQPLHSSTLEKDTNKLEVIYQLGYQQAIKNLDKIKEFMAED